MNKRIKDKIKTIKDDKTSFKEYIKCFCASPKAEEEFKNNDEFKRLKSKIKKEYN